MRFLLTSLMTYESEFYGVVGRELERRGNEVTHVTVSRQAARLLREQGMDARCLHDVAAEIGEPASVDDEVKRIESAYAINPPDGAEELRARLDRGGSRQLGQDCEIAHLQKRTRDC